MPHVSRCLLRRCFSPRSRALLKYLWLAALIPMLLLPRMSLTSDLLHTGEYGVSTMPLDRDNVEAVPALGSPSDWGAALRRLSPAERDNAILHIDLLTDAEAGIKTRTEFVSDLWNKGAHDDALEELATLQKQFPQLLVSVSVGWITPRQVQQPKGFGDDVLVNSRDSVLVLDMDVHYESHIIYLVLLTEGDGYNSILSLNRSVDNGLNWEEVRWLGLSSVYLQDVDISIAGDYVYMAYAFNTFAQVQRFDVYTGEGIEFEPGHYSWNAFSVSSPDSVMDISLVSNQDYSLLNPRFWMIAITKDHDLLFARNDTEDPDWVAYPSTGIHHADRGLDICMNYSYSEYMIIASYIDTTDYMRVIGTNLSTWTELHAENVYGSSAGNTAISAYDDNIYCLFECQDPAVRVRYAVSDNGGDDFTWGYIDNADTTSEAPAVCARRNWGVGVAYRYYTTPREGRFRWRHYAGGWEDPTCYCDNQPYWNNPVIQYLGAGQYGIAYLSLSDRQAFFDRGATHCCYALRGNVDGSPDNAVTLGDLNVLIDHLFVSLAPLRCWEEGNLDGSQPEGEESISLGDLTVLIDHLFVSFAPLPACP